MIENKFKSYEKFQDAINELKVIEPKPLFNYYYEEDNWSEDEYREDYNSICEASETFKKLYSAFLEAFDTNDILLQKYFYEKNDDFFKLAQSIKNTEYNNGAPYGLASFNQRNAEENNNLHNYLYEAINNIKKFINFTKTKDSDGNYYLTLIEIYALPKVLQEYYPEVFEEK